MAGSNLWLELVVAVIIPAVLVAASPKRWLRRVIVLWLVSPIFAYFGVIFWETLTRPTADYSPGTALYGFMLLSPLFTPPWLAVCAIGFGLGFAIRFLVGRTHGKTREVPEPPLVSAGNELSAAASSDVTPGWKNVHIGFDNDGLEIGGVQIWKRKWRSTGIGRVRLPHPAYPQQIHDYDVYEARDETGLVRFAAGELSNGVWGFYVLDLACIEVAYSFDLASDETIRVDFVPVEWYNSHWIQTPLVTHVPSGDILLDLRDTDWDATARFPSEGIISLDLRQYHNGGEMTVEIYPARDKYRIVREPGHQGALPEAPLATIKSGLEASSRRSADAKVLELGYEVASARLDSPAPLAAWRTALLIFVGASIAIASIAYVSLSVAPTQIRKTPLMTVPKPKPFS